MEIWGGGALGSFSSIAEQIAIPKCLYTTAHSMGNKYEELKVCMQGCGLVEITGHGGIAHVTVVLWWIDTGFLGKTGWKNEEVELPLIWAAGMREALPRVGWGANWELIKEQTNMGDKVVGFYCRPPDQEEQVDEAFYRQLRSGLTFRDVVSVRDFKHRILSFFMSC